MFSFETPIYNAIIIYILFITMILALKPKCIFDKGKLKDFGIGENKTLYSFPFVCISSGMLFYIFFLACERVFP